MTRVYIKMENISACGGIAALGETGRPTDARESQARGDLERSGLNSERICKRFHGSTRKRNI
jgi:hypothetical protein